MFDYNRQLEIIRRTEVELTNVTQKYTELLSSLSKDTLLNLNIIYASRKLEVLKEQNPKGISKEELEIQRNSEYEKYKNLMEDYIYQNYGKHISVDSIEYSSFINHLQEEEKENQYSATNLLENYKKELLQTYLLISPTVDIALPTHGITEINATNHRENQYLNEIIDGIYATSGKGILDYILRTNTGSMRGDGYNLDLPINPFSGVNDGKYILNKPASVYHLDARLFEPVIDFRLDANGNVNLRFDQEWISRSEKLKCNEEIVNYVPKEYVERKNITIQGQKMDLFFTKGETVQLTPELENIFNNIKNDSKYSSSQLMKKYASLPEYQLLITKIIGQTKKLEEEVKQIREKKAYLSDEMFFEIILSNYSKNIIETIKNDYAGKLTPEIIERLDNFSIGVINDPNKHGDMTAHSDICQVSINMAHFATDIQNLESKIVRAMGTMPHELFHFVFRILKDKNNVDERMVYNLSNGEQATCFGMVGHMLNEGFVEKLSAEFCQRNNIYYSPNPSYIQFTKLCNYIMKSNHDINEKFLIHNNYEGVLEKLSPEARNKYKETERFEYIGNFKLTTTSGEKRIISEQEIVSSFNEKIESKKKEELKPVQESKSSELKKSFDQRSQNEIAIAKQIKEKNIAIKKQKEQQKNLEKPKVKTLTKPTNSGGNSSGGFVNTLILTLITGFVAGAIFMVVYYICK